MQNSVILHGLMDYELDQKQLTCMYKVIYYKQVYNKPIYSIGDFICQVVQK